LLSNLSVRPAKGMYIPCGALKEWLRERFTEVALEFFLVPVPVNFSVSLRECLRLKVVLRPLLQVASHQTRGNHSDLLVRVLTSEPVPFSVCEPL